MKRKTWIYLATCALALTMFGCPDDDERPAACTSCEESEEVDTPTIKGTYISGHIGNYRDCPGDGYVVAASSAGAPAAEADADWAPGMCENEEDCSYIMNCEDGQITLRLTNSGLEAGLGLQVTKIELFNSEGVSKAILPLMDVTNTAGNTTFDGDIDASSEIILRVDFQGPQSPEELLASPNDDAGRYYYSNPGTIEVTFSAENHDDVLIISTELYAVPSVDT